MHIEKIVSGKLATNTYIVFCNSTKKAIVIDPAEGVTEISMFITDNNLEVKYIINTHGHADHISGNKKLYEQLDCQIAIGTEDALMLSKTDDQFAQYLGIFGKQPQADVLLYGDELLTIGDLKFRVINTPGHTPGGISLYNEQEKVLFSGDTLFYRSIGRIDLPGGNFGQIIKSLSLLCQLPGETVVYPGHGSKTTIAFEKENNKYCHGVI